MKILNFLFIYSICFNNFFSFRIKISNKNNKPQSNVCLKKILEKHNIVIPKPIRFVNLANKNYISEEKNINSQEEVKQIKIFHIPTGNFKTLTVKLSKKIKKIRKKKKLLPIIFEISESNIYDYRIANIDAKFIHSYENDLLLKRYRKNIGKRF